MFVCWKWKLLSSGMLLANGGIDIYLPFTLLSLITPYIAHVTTVQQLACKMREDCKSTLTPNHDYDYLSAESGVSKNS